MKVAIYTICKNEAKHVERFVQSCKGADGIFVLDTGSEDDSVQLLQDRGVVVKTQVIDPWRFDVARNANLEMIPDDYDLCICVDLDEILSDGWREKLDKGWSPGVTRVHYLYADDGGPAYWHHKAHARHGYHWRHAVHEELFHPQVAENPVWIDFEVMHKPDPSKSRAQYIDLLKIVLQESPTNHRAKIYFVIENLREGNVDEALQWVTDCLEAPGMWDIDRAYMSMVAADVWEKRGQDETAELWRLRAVAEAPEWRESWFNLAKHYKRHKKLELAIHAARKMIELENDIFVSYSDRSAWSGDVYRLAGAIAAEHGAFEEAKSFLKRGCRTFPDDRKLAVAYGEVLQS